MAKRTSNKRKWTAEEVQQWYRDTGAFTYANPDDDACGDIIPLVYTCKDCFFFKNGACNHPNEIRFTSKEDPSCEHFEYKEIKVEL